MTCSYKLACWTRNDVNGACNGLRFASIGEAQAYGRELEQRWLALDRWEVWPCNEPVTHRFDRDLNKAVALEVPPTPRQLAERLNAYALEHYNEGGWDYLVETMELAEIEAELVEHTLDTWEKALAHYEDWMNLLDERRREIDSTRW